MDRDGAGALTIRGLARALGVEPPALYWHFAGKDDLCRAVVDSVADQLLVSTRGRGRTGSFRLMPAAIPRKVRLNTRLISCLRGLPA